LQSLALDHEGIAPVEYPELFTQLLLEHAMDIKQKIHDTVTGSPVVLYMKGTQQAPQCGFSARAIQILQACGVKNLVTVDVLADPDVRQGVKDYANWPTVPQLYISGEFVGGSDIMTEMYQSGELQKQLEPIVKAH
jgi:monothiol glutaredoxin